mmetsp:Transcript_34880/g.54519  ORF Transcript_34880/g.54519 Transcript_34880/m.54519 type:complete len:250 (-) Transcript_34880:390-1139(-)
MILSCPAELKSSCSRGACAPGSCVDVELTTLEEVSVLIESSSREEWEESSNPLRSLSRREGLPEDISEWTLASETSLSSSFVDVDIFVDLMRNSPYCFNDCTKKVSNLVCVCFSMGRSPAEATIWICCFDDVRMVSTTGLVSGSLGCSLSTVASSCLWYRPKASATTLIICDSASYSFSAFSFTSLTFFLNHSKVTAIILFMRAFTSCSMPASQISTKIFCLKAAMEIEMMSATPRCTASSNVVSVSVS